MKISIYKIFLFLVLFSWEAHAQNKAIDSLQKVLQTQKEDTNKVNTLNQLSYEFAIEYDNNNNAIGAINNATHAAMQALTLSKKTNFIKGKAAAFQNIGMIYEFQNNLKEARNNYDTAIKYYGELDDINMIGDVYGRIASSYNREQNLPEALKNIYLSLKSFEKTGNKMGIAECYSSIGGNNLYQKNYDDALKNLLMSLKLFEEMHDKRGIARANFSLAILYLEQDHYAEALKRISYAAKIFEELQEKWNIAGTFYILGDIYAKHGTISLASGDSASAKDKFNEALKNYFSALKIHEEAGSKEFVARDQIDIGSMFLKLNNYSKAELYLEKSLGFFKQTGSKNNLQRAYLTLAELDSARGNFRQAYDHYKMYNANHDSIISQEDSKKSLMYKMQYESDKKEAVAKAEQEKKDYEQKRVRDLQYFVIASLTVLVLVILLIAFIQWRNNKQKKKANGLLVRQKEKIETTLAELKATQEQLIQVEKKQAVSNERLRISRELHDEVGATLSSISIFSQAAIQKNESGNIADSKNILERIGETSRDVMGELNDAVWLINPLNDNLQKIIQRVSNYALPLCRTNNIHFEINTAGSVENLALSVEERKAIYLIIKEAINNSLKYAAAKNLVIQFQQNQNALYISIKDDGKGFAENNSSSGNGLSNMQQRAKDVNGKIDFNSHEQKGTEIILEVPLTNIGD